MDGNMGSVAAARASCCGWRAGCARSAPVLRVALRPQGRASDVAAALCLFPSAKELDLELAHTVDVASMKSIILAEDALVAPGSPPGHGPTTLPERHCSAHLDAASKCRTGALHAALRTAAPHTDHILRLRLSAAGTDALALLCEPATQPFSPAWRSLQRLELDGAAITSRGLKLAKGALPSLRELRITRRWEVADSSCMMTHKFDRLTRLELLGSGILDLSPPIELFAPNLRALTLGGFLVSVALDRHSIGTGLEVRRTQSLQSARHVYV